MTYAVPTGYAELPCAFTRRRSVLANTMGTGLQPVGQRTIYLDRTDLVWQDRDVVEVYEGPSIYGGAAQRLEVVSITVPRGHHVELTGQEFAGLLPEPEEGGS